MDNTRHIFLGIVDTTLWGVDSIHSVLGFFHILVLLFFVAVVLLPFYLRGFKQKTRMWILALTLFAGLAICSMTVWWVIKALSQDAS